MDLDGKSILVTGGTGTFGRAFVRHVLAHHDPRRVIVYSRDELKQFELRQELSSPKLRFFIGDVRDRDRLQRAFVGVDYVVHAAAMKQVPAAEYNPFEAVKTNILGAQNIIEAAIERGVKRVVALSSDKAANPINLYGATKLVSDKLFIAANAYVGPQDTRFGVVRYGNVLGSRGSVVQFFGRCRDKGVLPVTDVRMTRFWLTVDEAVRIVMRFLERMGRGEIYVPKLPSMKVVDLAKAIAPGCRVEEVGIRPGEKLHEVLVPYDEARLTTEYDDHFVIRHPFAGEPEEPRPGGRPVHPDFSYRSNANGWWLDAPALLALVGMEPLGERIPVAGAADGRSDATAYDAAGLGARLFRDGAVWTARRASGLPSSDACDGALPAAGSSIDLRGSHGPTFSSAV